MVMRHADLGTLRRFFAKYVAAKARVSDERIVAAFATVPREGFVGPGPWQIPVAEGYIATETDDPTILYQDILIGLLPERGINNGEPTLHAKCIAAAGLHPNDVVIHVGAGTGYYTAILAQMVGRDGSVDAYEIEPELARRAQSNLADLPNVRVCGQSALATELPTADVIYVCAGVTQVPALWLDALAVGGRLVLPLVPNERLGCMLRVTRTTPEGFAAGIFSPANFIPCVGARDEAQSRALAAALDRGGAENVRSLRRGSEPDDSAWCVGRDWWLSTAQPPPR
jgi:protein-L-isoaspartate(D-aspartate) O-methyltransferase